MEKDYFISVFLDTRRELKNHTYPVKLRVFTRYPRKQKLYPTKFSFNEDVFKSTWETIKPRNEVKPDRVKIEALLKKAEEAAEACQPFTFEAFEKALLFKPGEKEDVFIRYDTAIKEYKQNKQIGTASNYECSKKSIEGYLEKSKGKKTDTLLFREINKRWLTDYENYMIEKGRSKTTIGIYLRPLKALFNEAIAEKVISVDLYPFGRKKYEIPAPKAVKKALTRPQLKELFKAKPATPEQKKAIDYFFFLFNCAGLNVKDLLRLKYENLDDDKLIYFREKTKRTTKADQKPIIVYLNDYSRNFIQEYGNTDKQPGNMIFDICTPKMTETEVFRQSVNFTRILNQHLQKLAKANNLPKISTYWSRHSFATNAIRGGASLEQISQALNHKDLQTTKSYFAGFEDEAMKELTANLMNF